MISDAGTVRSFATKEGIALPILLATQEVAGIYNLLYRQVFDRHRDMSIPIHSSSTQRETSSSFTGTNFAGTLRD